MINLHLHTNCSDSVLEPIELLKNTLCRKMLLK